MTADHCRGTSATTAMCPPLAVPAPYPLAHTSDATSAYGGKRRGRKGWERVVIDSKDDHRRCGPDCPNGSLPGCISH